MAALTEDVPARGTAEPFAVCIGGSCEPAGGGITADNGWNDGSFLFTVSVAAYMLMLPRVI